MALPTNYKDWKIASRIFYEQARLTRYSIQFYRKRGEWYDEIRFDSHDNLRGRTVRAPHFHIKIETRMKTDEVQAIEEIKRFIDNYLDEIQGAIGAIGATET